MMKKIIIVTGLLWFLSACQAEEPVVEETVQSDQLNIFLVNSSSDTLVEVAVAVDKSSHESQVEDVLHKLIFGAEDEGLMATIPDGTMIEAYEVVDRRVILHVTDTYLSMKEADRLICRSSLIKSLTAIDGVDAIEFYNEGLPLKDQQGKVYGPFYPEDIVTFSNNASEAPQSKTVLLYFPDDQGESLVQVSRDIQIMSGESLPERLLQELMILPDHLQVGAPIPESSEIISLLVNEGICYVDFNESFRTNHYGGSTGEMMTVYSIVNTLTELPNISRVQFLIEGEKTIDYKGHLDFSQLFEYNIEIVGKQ